MLSLLADADLQGVVDVRCHARSPGVQRGEMETLHLLFLSLTPGNRMLLTLSWSQNLIAKRAQSQERTMGQNPHCAIKEAGVLASPPERGRLAWK